jgi:hypothetical protein
MYRRPLSPYKGRAAFLDVFERDEAVNGLKKEYTQYRSVAAELDDLKYEITKAERTNRSIEQRNLEMEGQCIERIRGNKAAICDVGSEIERTEAKLKAMGEKVTEREAQRAEAI